MQFPYFDCCSCKNLLSVIHNPDKNGNIGKFTCRAYPDEIPKKARKVHYGEKPHYMCANGFGFEETESAKQHRLRAKDNEADDWHYEDATD